MKEWWRKHHEEVKAGARVRYARNKDKEHTRNLKRKFGLTAEKYQAKLHQQSHVCAICQQPDKRRLSVDHCHQTGQIRGLLCKKCNQFLWALEEPGWLVRAQQYLASYKE